MKRNSRIAFVFFVFCFFATFAMVAEPTAINFTAAIIFCDIESLDYPSIEPPSAHLALIREGLDGF